MLRKYLTLSTCLVFLVSGCENESSPTSPTPMNPTDQGVLALNLSGVEALTNGFHYEGWAIINGAPVSTGKFNVSSSGNLVDLDGNVITGGQFSVSADLTSASAIVITIEPAGDTDTVPADTKYMGGDLSGSTASLTVAHGSSLQNDFSSASGAFILATPTNGAGNNELSGVWFLSLASGMPSAALDVPALPAGWAYEGWVVFREGPVSTGTFTDPAASDDAAPYSGGLPGPPFPGEDYLQNAPPGFNFPTNLAGNTVVLSIEPVPDNDPAPFTLKPLAGMSPGSASSHVTYVMGNNAGSFPMGTATVSP